MTKASLLKANISLGLASRLGGLVHYHSREQGSMQADTVLEELRALHLDPKVTRRDWYPQAARRKLSSALCSASV